MRNKLLFLPLLIFSLFFSACSDDDVIDRIRTINDIPVSVNKTVDYLPINAFNFPIETSINLRAELEKELGTDEAINQVEEIELDDIDIVLVSADDQNNFDFVDSVTLSVRKDGLDIMQVASLDNVPKGVERISLNTTDAYLDEYISSEDLKLIVQFTSTEDANNITVTLDMEFDAKVNPSL
ncbi:hypothetical protein [Mesonia sp. HuA40]|uniref:hypothetical protein n=1 Tax=Mesonia sp. HuA40 TaxID=2602761 RepID=UPI0011CAA81F|nr:hypothetical protein [Mesonia sp. HuA40]TXK71062.1 hypothetical protein FT993_10810 [Mesonia sp. HuA40]